MSGTRELGPSRTPGTLDNYFGSIVLACVLATIAFWAYSRTLLPGVDLGDTGGFQAAILRPEVSARQGYPLYYGLAKPFVAMVSAANPARGLNLFSAVWAAGAVGILAFLVATLTSSLGAGAVAGLLLAFSYTFWTQAVIAEVYSLHLALVGACLIALYSFWLHPTRPRLILFFVVYVVSFGNHLSMILLLVPFTLFLLQTSRLRREVLRPSTVCIAIAIAIVGALQYAPDFIATWNMPGASPAWSDRFASFWFDATKADWREQSVLGIEIRDLRERLAMWIWDARQQFGVAGLTLALVGAVRLWWLSRAWAVLVWTAFACSTLFAITYNVGDTHVFFLPGHFWTAFAAGVAVATTGGTHVVPSRTRRVAAASLITLAVAYAGWRGWDTWPAADRHQDRRATQLVARVTYGVSDRHTLLVTEMDWQSENALLYASRFERTDLTWIRLPDVLLHFPFLVRDNHELGRDILLTPTAAGHVVSAYGATLPLVQDETLPVPSVIEQIRAIPSGTPYVLTLLTPTRDERLSDEEVEEVHLALTGEKPPARDRSAYEVMAGIKGVPAPLHRSSNRPFTEHVTLAGRRTTIRMDSWLPSDTFRRGGFGHVVSGRDHLLLVERGLSLVWLSADGRPAYTYAAGLYSPQPRFRIPARVSRLARELPRAW